MGLLLFGGTTESIGDERARDLREAAAPLQVLFTTDAAEMLARATEVEVAVADIPVSTLEALPGLTWYQHWYAGVENLVHIPHFTSGSTRVTNGSGVHAEPIAQQFFGMLLSMGRNLPEHHVNQTHAEWTRTQMGDVFELDGMSLLVVGMGAIGRRIAELGRAFGMTVSGIRRTVQDDIVPIHPLSALPDLLPTADVVVCILPLTPETELVFDAAAFRAMKRTAVFSNFGRGRHADQAALTTALRDGTIRGALLDVTDPEPLPANHELWSMPNVLITPHTGGWTNRYTQRIWPILMENLAHYHAGEPLVNTIDFARGY